MTQQNQNSNFPPPPPPPPPPLAPPPLGYATPRHLTPGMPPQRADLGTSMLIPIGRSGWAIAAGYFGLFSVLVIFAPVSVVISILAIRDLKRHPELRGWGRAIFGLVMGIIFTLPFFLFIAAFIFKR